MDTVVSIRRDRIQGIRSLKKMFIFVLNGSFVSCELRCSVCKAAKSICTWDEKVFLLNSMVLHNKNSKGVV